MYPKEAALKLGMSARQVRHLLAIGELKGRKRHGHWYILDLNYERKRRLVELSKPQVEVLEALKNGSQLRYGRRRGPGRRQRWFIEVTITTVWNTTLNALEHRGFIAAGTECGIDVWRITDEGKQALESVRKAVRTI